jgi:threonine dehydratase
MIPVEWLDQAAIRIAPHIRRTLITNDAEFNLYLKWENRQVTGSFKVRGALNKVLALEPWESQAGLVTASAGNHGQGVALAAGLVGAPVTVFVSGHAVPSKVEAMRQRGVDVRPVDGGYEAAEVAAIRYADEHKMVWVSPYNDGQVMAGQGTLGLEILEELPEASAVPWLVPVGGGGLLAGIGAALERTRPRPRLVGVQSEASAFMHSLFHRGTQDGVRDLPSLADGLAGAVEAGSLTVPLVKRYAEDVLLVSETAIGQAVAFAWYHYGERIEGSGAVGLAAILSGKVKSPAMVVVSGGNIQPEVHDELCHRYPEK